MFAANQANPALQKALDAWANEGGDWLQDADRVIAETQRLLRNLEEREDCLLSREQSLQKWQINLEDREKLLLDREKLLTVGMLELESSNRDGASTLLQEITREIAELRRSLIQVQPSNSEPNLASLDLGITEAKSTEPILAPHQATVQQATVQATAVEAATSPSFAARPTQDSSRRSKRRSRK